MNSLHLIIENYRSEVELVITGLDRFTSVMQAISDIKKTAIQAEVRYTTYQVCFIKVPLRNFKIERSSKISICNLILLSYANYTFEKCKNKDI